MSMNVIGMFKVKSGCIKFMWCQSLACGHHLCVFLHQILAGVLTQHWRGLPAHLTGTWRDHKPHLLRHCWINLLVHAHEQTVYTSADLVLSHAAEVSLHVLTQQRSSIQDVWSGDRIKNKSPPIFHPFRGLEEREWFQTRVGRVKKVSLLGSSSPQSRGGCGTKAQTLNTYENCFIMTIISRLARKSSLRVERWGCSSKEVYVFFLLLLSAGRGHCLSRFSFFLSCFIAQQDQQKNDLCFRGKGSWANVKTYQEPYLCIMCTALATLMCLVSSANPFQIKLLLSDSCWHPVNRSAFSLCDTVTLCDWSHSLRRRGRLVSRLSLLSSGFGAEGSIRMSVLQILPGWIPLSYLFTC